VRFPEGSWRNAVVVVALLSAGFAAAYLRLLPHIERESGWTDGLREVALEDRAALRYAVWDEPVPLGPAVNGPEAEGRASVSPDGTQMVFAVGEPGLNADLWVTELLDGEPVDPRPLSLANSPFDEIAPAFGPDALWLASNRPGGEGGFDLLRLPWRNGVFEPPERLPDGLATEYDELDPAPVPGSRALAFASDLPRGRRTDTDLYLAAPAADGWRVEALAAVNSPFDERDPAFAADGRILLLSSDRDGGAGGFDLYRAVQGPEGWLEPDALVGVNGPGDERAPSAVLGGFGLLMTSAPAGGVADLHRARSLELFRLPGRPIGWMDLTVVGLLLLLALLTWLGRRWEALDILAKCLLVSLLAHLLMMLWFREVYVENEVLEPPPPTTTFKVRLSADPRQVTAATERAGEVEAAPSHRAEASAPERSASEAPSGGEARAVARATLSAPSLPAAQAPGAQADSASAAQREARAEVRIEQPAVSGQPVNTAEAPGMSLAAAAAGPSQPTTRATASGPAREQAASVVLADPSPSTSGRASSALPMPVVAAAAAPSSSSRAALSPSSRAATRPVEVGAPPVASSDGASASSGDGASEPTPFELGSPSGAADLSPSLRSGAAPTRFAQATSGSASGSVAPRMTAFELPTPDLTGGGPASERSAAQVDLGARALADMPLAAGPPSVDTDLTVGTSGSPATDERVEGVGALALATPSTRTAPSRGTSAPARPGRWSSTSDVLALDMPAPAQRTLAAPTAVAAALPEVRAGPFDHTPYRTRFGEARVQALAEGGGNEETERAVAKGLEYLARVQSADGRWGSQDDYHDKYGHVVVGKTALCLLAFLGAGHSPDSGREYAVTARRARDFLLAVQDERTGHFGYSSSYSHAIATYALSECFALDGDALLPAPLRRAVSWIIENQNRQSDPRRRGGWGYYYPDGRVYDPWPRTSVSAWQVMALESARLAGLSVPDRVFADARSFLDQNHDARGGVVLYTRDPERLDSAYPTLPGSTPAGLFALSLLGEDLTDARWRSAIDFTLSRRPSGYEEPSRSAFVSRAAGNLYFWYYGSLALFRHGGQPWERWNQALQETLLPSQRSDGSWQPISLYGDYAGDDNRDRSYTTAMCVLTLEVYYRYFTPLLVVQPASGGSGGR
jgi:hypothetical protein